MSCALLDKLVRLLVSPQFRVGCYIQHCSTVVVVGTVLIAARHSETVLLRIVLDSMASRYYSMLVSILKYGVAGFPYSDKLCLIYRAVDGILIHLLRKLGCVGNAIANAQPALVLVQSR